MNSLKDIDPSTIKWKSIRKEGLNLDYAVAIPRSIASTILKELERTVEYFTGDLSKITVFGKVYPLPRQQVAYGDPGITYRYSGKTIPALSWPAPVLALRDFLEAIKGIKYDFVLINKYRNGNDHMGEHRDNEPELDPTYPIASISLGQERDFVLKHKDARKPGPNKRPIPPAGHSLRVHLECSGMDAFLSATFKACGMDGGFPTDKRARPAATPNGMVTLHLESSIIKS